VVASIGVGSGVIERGQGHGPKGTTPPPGTARLEKNAALDYATAAGLQLARGSQVARGLDDTGRPIRAGYGGADANATYMKWVDGDDFWAAAGYFLHHMPGPRCIRQDCW
jgi:hypothetical protein